MVDYNKIAEKAANKAGLSTRKINEVKGIMAKVIKEEVEKEQKKKLKKKVVLESKDILEPENTYIKK
jgi:hypothetical protein